MTDRSAVLTDFSLLTDHDIYLYKEGNHFRLYDKLGAHLIEKDGLRGTQFAVWAPNAASVSVVGDFNQWNPQTHPLAARWDHSGIWEGFVPNIGKGSLYKYHIVSNHNQYSVNKGDPFAFFWEMPPRTASMVWDLDYRWTDDAWLKKQAQHNSLNGPQSIYEVHLGSWRRDPGNPARLLSYNEIAKPLTDYIKDMGFTHVEFLPVMEHPFYGSWGYQTLGYFAPTSRYGSPQDLMYLIDYLHRNDIGVILDWVPSHFPTDEYGLGYFDGTHLYEHSDPRLGFHPDWRSAVFNYGRNEVRAYLISSAMFWLDKYHADALRVDAVASMLYLDYSRKEGEWIPNQYGGRENIEAINFLRRFNQMVYRDFPNIQTVAEESTAWPMVTKPIETGGLGFGMKWNMGWMHDTLEYFTRDSVHRKYHQGNLTFSAVYAFSENFILPLSHDEVVHGKGSLYNKMPGDSWQKFANLRLLFGYMYTHAGKKLLFMGGEFAQQSEWTHEHSLDWHLLGNPQNAAIQAWIRDLNHFYRNEPALYETDFHGQGFEWIDYHDADNSVITYLRKNKAGTILLAVACNFTPVPRSNYRMGVPAGGFWKEVLNSDATYYGGSGQGNMGGVEASPASFYGRFDHTLSVMLPPLGVVVFRKDLTAESESQEIE
ncbi:MAG: 1,4-alpha-glucan branching protein GlgB [Solirubrobacterales bacterium]